MVHIGKDKRQQLSAGLICEGMSRLTKTMPFERVTVSALVNEAGVGRSTFYRLFDEKEDVILYQMEMVFDDLLNRLDERTEPRRVLTELFSQWLSRRELFFALIRSGVYERFQAKLTVVVAEKLSFIKKARKVEDRAWQYFVNIRAGMLFAALKVAVVHYPEDTPADVIEMLGAF